MKKYSSISLSFYSELPALPLIKIDENKFLHDAQSDCYDFDQHKYARYNVIISNTSKHHKLKPAGSEVSFMEYKRMETAKFLKNFSRPKAKFRELPPLERYTVRLRNLFSHSS